MFNDLSVRAIADDRGEPWFCAADVCSVLGYRNAPDAVAKHCREKGIAKRDTLTSKGNQELTFINEGNLYRLIVKSRKPEAEKFEQLVMDEILPTIRKTGQYTAPGYRAAKTRKALPGGLTIEQQDAVKAHHAALVQSLPHDKQAAASIRLWSSVKAKFGVGYKEVPPEAFPEVVSLMSRVAVASSEWLPAEHQRKESSTLRGQSLIVLKMAMDMLADKNMVIVPLDDMAVGIRCLGDYAKMAQHFPGAQVPLDSLQRLAGALTDNCRAGCGAVF